MAIKYAQNITPKDLLALGYQKYAQHLMFGSDKPVLWQNCFRDERGKKYFVNFNEYDFSTFDHCLYDISYEVDMQFTVPDIGTVNVVLLLDATDTVASVEGKVAKLFNKLGAQYYEEN